jgi:outer membrane protein TolC
MGLQRSGVSAPACYSPSLHGRTLSAQQRAAVTADDQAAARYLDTVLSSFQTVADCFAQGADARTLKAQAESESIAGESLDLTRKQFYLGAISCLSLLNAQRQ